MSSASHFKIVYEGEFEREVGEEEFEYEEYSLEVNRKSRIRVALTDSGHGFGVSKTFKIRRKDEKNEQYVSRSDDEIEKMRNDISYRNKFEVILDGQGETWCELAVNDAGFNDTRSYTN
jgi:hypothetical protein